MLVYAYPLHMILGMSVPTKNDGSVVSFAVYSNAQLALKRSNERHDFLLQQRQKNKAELTNFPGRRGRPALREKHRLLEKGVTEPCVFRTLLSFDVSGSFLIDSLHNIYLGLFVSVIHTFLFISSC